LSRVLAMHDLQQRSWPQHGTPSAAALVASARHPLWLRSDCAQHGTPPL